MALKKVKETNLVDVGTDREGHPLLQIREKVSIKEGSETRSWGWNRLVINPNTDLTNSSEHRKDVASAVFTDKIKKEFKEKTDLIDSDPAEYSRKYLNGE